MTAPMSDIQMALATQARTYTTYTVVGEEEADTFKPEQSGGSIKPYVQFRNYPNGSAWEGLGDEAMRQGIFTVTVYWPKNQGMVKPYAQAEAIAAVFAKSTVLTYGSATVTINNVPDIRSPVVEPDRVGVPVLIRWVAV